VSHDLVEDVRSSSYGLSLLPKDRTILERECMAFRPFGVDERGEKIRDLTGMSIRATILFLESYMARVRGEAAGPQAVQELCALLNQRIKDPVYHVTPAFLKNAWNSYSYEFTAYLYEFCEQITGDPKFVFKGGMEKASPIMQVLARPFSLSQIYGMFPYFGNKFASGSIECRVVAVTRESATLALRFSDRTLHKFGPYRRRCAYVMCQAAQGIMAAVPVRVHGLPPATLIETSCIANDDEWCQWNITWSAEPVSDWRRRIWRRASSPSTDSPVFDQSASPELVSRRIDELFPSTEWMSHEGSTLLPPSEESVETPDTSIRATMRQATQSFQDETKVVVAYLWGLLAGGATSLMLRLLYPAMNMAEILLAGVVPVLITGAWITWRLRNESRRREALIHEQMEFVESRHEELREAYLEQEQTRVQLRRKVNHLMVLHRAGLLFNSTLDRETLLQQALETLTSDLHYDRAMISFYDPLRQVTKDVRLVGVSPDIAKFARLKEAKITDPDSPEGQVLLQGRPLLIGDARTIMKHMHPLNQQLARMTGTKSFIAVPLRSQDKILGALMVDRMQEHALTVDDLELMVTFAHQVAIALDNASAYRQIEELNVGLEAKVRERTAELEQADRLRSQFLSHVSHELKTPMTSIKGFVQNMLDGLTGSVNEKQQRYLTRMLENAERLIRMIEDLLDRTRIQTGRLELAPAEIDLSECVADAIEQLRPLAQAKRQQLDARYPSETLTVWADRDRLFQVVTNLVQNAVKFTPEEGRVVVTVAQESPRHGKLTVHDTGPGIPPEYLEKIFDPFFRVKQARTGVKGLGLGLSIVRTLVELHGGTIGAANRAGQGAEFVVTLPLRIPSDVPVREEEGSGPRVLIVDEDADVRQMVADRLRARGYQVQVEADGRGALDAVESNIYSGLILDIGISSVDGLEVLRQIRRRDQQMPIIMVTASGTKETAIRAIGMGAQAYLLKPFDGEELQRVVDSWFKPHNESQG